MANMAPLSQNSSIKSCFCFTHKTLAIKRLYKRFAFVRYSVWEPFARCVILPHEMTLIIAWNDADCSIKSVILARWTHQMVLLVVSISIIQSSLSHHKPFTLWDTTTEIEK